MRLGQLVINVELLALVSLLSGVAAVAAPGDARPPSEARPAPVQAAPVAGDGADDVAAIGLVLDSFHAAAARADEDAYFSFLAPDAVFLGTAPGERWPRDEFRAFVHPYFSKGRGWTYAPRHEDRHVLVHPDGRSASFDEVLDNDAYGRCRGTGVLHKIDGRWLIVQYNLMLPVPNEITAEVVERIRGLE